MMKLPHLWLLFGLIFSFNISSSFAQNSFDLDTNEEHYFLIVMTDRAIDIPETRAGITKYVWMNHASEKLKISHILIGENRSVSAILIESFANIDKGMKFYNGIKKNRPDFTQMGLTKDYFLISKSNYVEILKNKSLDGYSSFFDTNYLK